MIADPGGLETRTRPILRHYRQQPGSLCCVIPEIDIWRAVHLMLKRYGDQALKESAARSSFRAAKAAGWHRAEKDAGMNVLTTL